MTTERNARQTDKFLKKTPQNTRRTKKKKKKKSKWKSKQLTK